MLCSILLGIVLPEHGRAQGTPDTPIFSANFNDFSGPATGFQHQTGLPIVSGASPDGWAKEGTDAVRLVNHGTTAADWAAVIYHDDRITMASGVDANDAGVTYTVAFDLGPSVFDNGAHATRADEQLSVWVVDEENDRRGGIDVVTGAWNGNQSFTRRSFTYNGIGNGTVRLTVVATSPSPSHISGAIDNITITAAPSDADNDGLSDTQEGIIGTDPNVADPAATTVGSLFDFTVDFGLGASSFTATGLPAGLFINPVTGQITGTPTAVTTAPGTVVAVSAESAAGGPVSRNILFRIDKGNLVLSAITATGITYGQKLSDATVTGTAKNASGVIISGSWAFQNPDTQPAAGIGQNFPVTFTPGQTENYNTVSGAVSLNVTGASLPSVTFTGPGSLTYDGTGKAYTATASGVSGFSYTYRGRNSTSYPSSDEPPVNAGDYTVTAASTDPNYSGFAEENFTISKATANLTITNENQTYNGLSKQVTVTTLPASLAVLVQYNGETAPPVNAGTYPVLVTVTDPNHTGSKNGTLTIAKADPGIAAAPTASAITYGESLGASTLTGGTPSVPGTFAFKNPATTPNAGLAQNFKVVFTPTDSANYESVEIDVPVTVNPAPLTITGISIADKPFDGTTTATVNGTASYVGLQGTDDFAVAGTPTAAFLTPDVGNAKPVTVSGYTAPSANYTVTQPSGLTASITVLAGMDSDDDGVSDVQETLLGSSPTDAMSMPKTKIIYWGPATGVAAAGIPTNLPSDIVKISAGVDFALALSSAGRVYAWGANESGQTNVPAALSGVVDILAGGDFAYARKADGSVVGWGSAASITNLPGNIVKMASWRNQGLLLDSAGRAYQRGPDNLGTANVNTDSNWQSGVTDIGAARYNHIAVKAGAARVVGIVNHNSLVVPAEAQANVQSVIAHGGSTQTAILSNNQVVMWGKADSGQISGLRTIVQAGSLSGVTVTRTTSGTGNFGWEELVLSQSGSPAIRKFFPTQSYWSGLIDKDGKIWAWGNPANGLPTATVPVAMAANVVQASGGGNFALALVLDQDGDGLADNVETNTGTYVSADNTGTDPAAADTDGDGLNDGVETGTGVFVSATNTGTNPNLADTDGDGVSDGGEVAAGTDPNEPFDRPTQLASGTSHTLYIPVIGDRVLAWGANSVGQCGLGHNTSPVTSGVPVLEAGGAILSNAVAVAAGAQHSLILQVDTNGVRRVFTAGTNPAGQLGLGTNVAAMNRFTPIPGLTNVRSVVSGDAFALARDGDGRIWAWGFNGFGQLGNGNLNSQFQPQAIGGAKRFSFVAAGAEHAVALDTNGVLHTWGRGNYGQLGLGGVQRTNVPSALTLNFTNATNKVIQAGAGLAQTFVLTEEGEVWAFGRNDLGQLGLGTNVILTNVPTRISNAIAANGASVALPEIRRLSVGPRRVMAIARNGTVYGWGYNRFGELGLAPSTNAPLYCEYLPTEVPALYGSLEIAGGAYQTFALDSSGTLLALGFNEGGQLGIGNTDPVSGGPTPTTEAGKSTQTITFNRTNVVGAITVGGSVFLTGTASSALPLVYTVSDTNLASVTSNTVTLLATGTLAITARQPGDSNFNAGAPVTVSNLVIAKATPSVTWTNPTPITYGTILSGSQLNAEASTPGTFTYTPAAGTVLNAGTNLLSAVFTADDPTNYVSPLTNTVSLVVNKATPTITAPSASAITEGQELGASTLSGGSASVEGTFAWTTPSTVPPASGSYSVTFTPTDAANYETVSVNVAVTVLDPAADEDGDGLSNLQEIEDGTDPFSPAPVVGYLGIVQMYFQDGSGTPGLGLPWRQVGGSNAVAQKVMMAKVSTGLEATKVEVGLEGEAGVTPVATLSTQIPGTLYDEFELAPENELFFATTNAAEANLAVGSYLFQPMAFTNPVAETNSVVWTDQPYPSQAPRVTTDAWSNSALRITNVFVTNTLAWELWSGGGPKDQIRLQFRRQGDATVYTHNLAASETNRVFEPGDFGSTNSVWECSISFLKFSARGALRGKETHFYISTGPDFPAPTAGTDPAFAPATGVYGESFSFGTVAPGGTIQVTGSNLAGVTKASFDLFDTNSGSTYAILDDVTATASSVTIPIPQFQAEGSYQLRYIGGTTPQVLGTITVSGGASPFENNVNLTSINSVISVPMPSAALGPMTLEFWIKPSSSLSSGTYRLVSKNGPTGNSELAIDLNFTSSTVANLSAKVTPTGGFATTASVDLANPLGWTHVAMVISSFSVQLFADGTAGSSFSLTSGLNWSSLQLVFGNGFRGQLDDIRIYSGSRTGTQINADKTGPALSPYETSLKAYYKLDEGMGTSLADATGQNGAATAGNIGWGPGRSPGVWNISHGDYSLQNDGTQLLMELGGMEGTTLYDQIFVRSGAATLDGIVNLMFIGSYTGPVSGSWHTFDLIWAQNGIVFGDNYQLTFNQPGFTVDTSVVQKDGGQLWQATVRQAASQADLEQAAALAQPVMGLAQSPGPAGSVEMLYTYTRPTGGSYVNGQYLVGGVRYEVQVSGDLRSWSPAALEEVAVIPFGAGYEHATVRVVVGGTKAFLKLEVSN